MLHFVIFCLLAALFISGLIVVWNGYDQGDGFVIAGGTILILVSLIGFVFHP